MGKTKCSEPIENWNTLVNLQPELEELSNINKSLARMIFFNYPKFATIREPLDRLVSIWHEKLVGKNGEVAELWVLLLDCKCIFHFILCNHFQEDVGQSIAKNYRPLGSTPRLPVNGSVTLEEFVMFLNATRKNFRSFNSHWYGDFAYSFQSYSFLYRIPMSEGFCNHCEIR